MKKKENFQNTIIQGDVLAVLKTLPDDLVDTIITSPPYWGLRDYGVKGQIGLEPTLDEFIGKLLKITTELKRVLKPTGVMYWNHGDNYGSSISGGLVKNKGDGLYERKMNRMRNQKETDPRRNIDFSKIKEKCLCLQNYRLIIEMINQGWILRNTIIWHKPNHMPSSVKDRFSNSYEPVFMLVKNKKYWFDLDAVRVKHKWADKDKRADGDKHLSGGKTATKKYAIDGVSYHSAGKNPGDVWKIATQPFSEAHFATFPEKLIEPMILSSCPKEICKKCGKARVRIVKTTYKVRAIRKDTEKQQNIEKGKGRPNMPTMANSEHQTIGWTDCSCKAGFKAGIVLDPFIGSGTIAVVAKRYMRSWLGIELNEEYIKIAKKRITAQPMPML